MRAFAEKHFALAQVDKDGVSFREALEGLRDRTKRADKRAEYEAQLACPPIPDELRYLWRSFNRLSARRGSNGFDVDPIGWCEIDAFVRLTGVRLVPWEIELIEMLDDIFRSERARNRDNDEEGNKTK